MARESFMNMNAHPTQGYARLEPSALDSMSFGSGAPDKLDRCTKRAGGRILAKNSDCFL